MDETVSSFLLQLLQPVTFVCGKHSIRQIIDFSSMVKWNVYVLTVYMIEFEAALQLASKQELLSMIVMLIKSPYFNLWYRQG